jgi:hypothetical protein
MLILYKCSVPSIDDSCAGSGSLSSCLGSSGILLSGVLEYEVVDRSYSKGECLSWICDMM